jgi:hypothetical protein
VLATDNDVSALQRATRPVYAHLERDPLTKSLIARIRAIVASLPDPPRMQVPASCSHSVPAAPQSGSLAATSALNGTYRRLMTLPIARAFGAPATDPGNTYPTLFTTVLRNGRFFSATEGDPPDQGTYRVVGSRIVLTMAGFAYDMTFTFVRDRDGTLHLTPVLPMERGDQFVWSGVPWRKIGPPQPIRRGR